MGRFTVREERGKIVVDFTPALLLDTSGKSPEVPVSDNHTEALAILLCHKVFEVTLNSFALIRGETLLQCASRVMASFISDLTEELAGYLPESIHERRIDFDPAHLYPRALAYSTYYSYVYALSRILQVHPVTVDLIGTFDAHRRISFVCSNQLLGLLSASRLAPA
jgi:hypothetical protein